MFVDGINAGLGYGHPVVLRIGPVDGPGSPVDGHAIHAGRYPTVDNTEGLIVSEGQGGRGLQNDSKYIFEASIAEIERVIGVFECQGDSEGDASGVGIREVGHHILFETVFDPILWIASYSFDVDGTIGQVFLGPHQGSKARVDHWNTDDIHLNHWGGMHYQHREQPGNLNTCSPNFWEIYYFGITWNLTLKATYMKLCLVHITQIQSDVLALQV